MIGFPTIASSRMSSTVTPARREAPRRGSRWPPGQPVISAAPPSWSIAYETRLMRSSPKRICGFITPSEARTAPSRGSRGGRRSSSTRRRWPRRARDRGGPARCRDRAAVVDRDRDAVPARLEGGLERAMTSRSASRPRQAHSRSSAASRRARSPPGEARAGRSTSTSWSRTTGSMTKSRTGSALADDLAVDLALRRHVDEDVAADVARQPGGARRRGRAAGRTRPRSRRAARDGRRSTRCRASGTSLPPARPGSGRTCRARRTRNRCPRRASVRRRARSCRSRSAPRPDGVKMTCGLSHRAAPTAGADRRPGAPCRGRPAGAAGPRPPRRPGPPSAGGLADALGSSGGIGVVAHEDVGRHDRALTSAASGFVIADVSPVAIAIGRNAALIRSRSGMPN